MQTVLCKLAFHVGQGIHHKWTRNKKDYIVMVMSVATVLIAVLCVLWTLDDLDAHALG